MAKYCPIYNFKDTFFEILPGRVCWNYACLTEYFIYFCKNTEKWLREYT